MSVATLERTERQERQALPVEAAVRPAGVSDAELALYREAVAETCGYIRHADFDAADADSVILGMGLDEFAAAAAAGSVVGPATMDPLTAGQERDLFRKLNYLRFRTAELVGRVRDRAHPAAGEVRAIAALRRPIRQIRDRITEANTALVLSMAAKVRNRNPDFPEMISEGNMALLRAVDKFDFGRGFKFSTYACRAILKSFSRSGVQANRYRQRFPVGYEPEMAKSDWVDARRDRQEADALSDLREVLAGDLSELTDIERTVIRERFALAGGSAPKTLAEVGELVGLTKERVRQIQNRSLAKIRQMVESRGVAA